jgi:hypothetical protein
MTNLVGRTLYRLGERLPGQVSMLGEDGSAATHPARVARFANPWRVVAGAVAGLPGTLDRLSRLRQLDQRIAGVIRSSR